MSITKRDQEHATQLASRAFEAVRDAVKPSGRPVTMDDVLDTFMSLAAMGEYAPDDEAEWSRAAGRLMTNLLAAQPDVNPAPPAAEPAAEPVQETTSKPRRRRG